MDVPSPLVLTIIVALWVCDIIRERTLVPRVCSLPWPEGNSQIFRLPVSECFVMCELGGIVTCETFQVP